MMEFMIATSPGSPDRENEDFAGALGDCAVLLDGSGSPGSLRTGCYHGVPWFVRQLGSACLAGAVTAPHGVPLSGILARAIAAVSALHVDTCDLSLPGTPSGIVVMVRLQGGFVHYLVLGDSALVVEEHGKPAYVITDLRMENVMPPEYQKVLALRTGSEDHLRARVDFVRRQQLLRNAPGGYPVASTDPLAAFKALEGRIPLAEVCQMALVTDGVTRFESFGLGSWQCLLGILGTSGAGELFRQIRSAEESDPEGARWPRAKESDDVACVHWFNPDCQHAARPGC